MKIPRLLSLPLIGAGLCCLVVSAFEHPFSSIPKFREDDEANDPDSRRADYIEQALKFRELQMQDEHKRVAVDGLLKAKKHLDVMRTDQKQRAALLGKTEAAKTFAALKPDDWLSIGPGNVGGRIRAIAIDPNNANSIFVGSAGGGIWHTPDGGTTWQPVDDFMANLAVSSLLIDPANPSVMYAGTGELSNVSASAEEQDIAPDGLRGLGLFKSTDGGVTWAQLPSTNPADPAVCANAGYGCAWSYINRLAISNNGVLLAATTTGILRSTDGGATWTLTGARGGAFYDVEFAPGSNLQVVASGLAAAGYSTDGGVTWANASFDSTFVPKNTGLVELAYAPSDPTGNTVFASVNANQGDLYRSIDGGRTYVQVSTGTKFLAGQGNYGNTLWVDPQDANTVVVGGVDLYRSSNAATANPISWTQISAWQCGPGQHGACSNKSAHADHHIIVSAPGYNNSTNKRVYFGTDGGLFRTDDVLAVGQQNGWVNLNHNLNITQFYSGASSAAAVLFGGTQDNGNVAVKPTAGESALVYDSQAWYTPFGGTGDGGFVAADPTDSNFLYIEYVNLEISQSADGGDHFFPIYGGITDADTTANFIAPFVLDPGNSARLLAGGTSLWRNNDVKHGAPAWTAIKSPATPLPTPAPPPGSSPSPLPTPPISAIAISAKNSDFVVVGHNDGQIFLSQNGTAASPAWANIDTGTPRRFVTRLVIDSTHNPNWIYATFGGFSPDNIYLTKDLGVTWTDITGSGATGLPDVPVRSLAINPIHSNYLYVGTEVGIFASEDGGATWQLPQGGPANVSVDEVFFSNGYLTAATHGRGFYTTHKPLFQNSATCAYSGSSCDGTSPSCAGFWDCPCTWPNHQVPGSTDDVYVSCPVTVRGTAYAKSLTVGSRLDFLAGASVFMPDGDFVNYGTISAATELRTKNFANSGIITAGRIWALGDLFNSGTIVASGGWSFNSGVEYPVTANNITIEESQNGSASIAANAVLCKGNLAIATNGLLQVLFTTPQGSLAPLSVAGNVLNLGALDVRGEMSFTNSNSANPNVIHTLTGTGDWHVGALTVGSRPDFQYGSGSTLLLANDLTLNITELPNAPYGRNSFLIASNGTIKQNGHDLTINSPSMQMYGQFDLGGGDLTLNIPYIRETSYVSPGRSADLGFPGFAGAGTVHFASPSTSGDFQMGPYIFAPAFHFAAGRADAQLSTELQRGLTIDQGATLNFNAGTIRVSGDVTVNGTLGKSAGIGGDLYFYGNTFTNNGSITGGFLGFNWAGNASRSQTIVGNGAWPSGRQVMVGFVNGPTLLTLANDVTLGFSKIGIWSNSSVRTESNILTMPCGSTFDQTYGAQEAGEITGNVRRTGLSDCNGAAVPFHNPWTTLKFDSGTPPSDVLISMGLGSPPAGLTNGVARNYNIIANGGSGFSATLRLHYLSSELNGNPEQYLALWRNDGTNWIAQGATARDFSNHWVEYSGVTAFSPWGLASCSTSLAPNSASVASGGGMGSFQVNCNGGCSWTASSDSGWITVTGASGSGNGSVSYNVSANTGTARSGTITVNAPGAAQVFTITQAADCSSLSLTPTSKNFTANGAYDTIAVSSPSGCSWTANAQNDWIYIYPGSEGTGDGTVQYYVNYNPGLARTGAISISGKTFTITQDSGCYAYLGSYDAPFVSAGGNGSVDVYASDTACSWNAVVNGSWITLNSPASGTGNATLQFTVAPNSGPPRHGSITVGDYSMAIRQGSNASLNLVVTNNNDAGPGSLRQALTDSNDNIGQSNTISFDIAGDVTITPVSESWPNLTTTVTLNGINSDGRRIVIDGQYGFYGGFSILAPNCSMRGFCLVRLSYGTLYIQADNTDIENCIFGTDSTGAAGLGNWNSIQIYSNGNHFGRPVPNGGNVVVGTVYDSALYIDGNALGNFIQNNRIGVLPDGTPMPNVNGLSIAGIGTVIGGTLPLEANTIAYNTDFGVAVYFGSQNPIRGNSIFENGGIGIDLGIDGVSPNDAPPPPYPGNHQQKFPVLAADAGASKITGTLNAEAGKTFLIDFYGNDSCDPSGYGEGRRYLGTISAATDPAGFATFTFELPSTVTTGQSVTATATDPDGNTSEFSACLAVNPMRVKSMQRLPNGHYLLQGIGVPNQQHTLEILAAPNAPSPLATVSVSVDATGNWQCDITPAGASSQFYRLRYP